MLSPVTTRKQTVFGWNVPNEDFYGGGRVCTSMCVHIFKNFLIININVDIIMDRSQADRSNDSHCFIQLPKIYPDCVVRLRGAYILEVAMLRRSRRIEERATSLLWRWVLSPTLLQLVNSVLPRYTGRQRWWWGRGGDFLDQCPKFSVDVRGVLKLQRELCSPGPSSSTRPPCYFYFYSNFMLPHLFTDLLSHFAASTERWFVRTQYNIWIK